MQVRRTDIVLKPDHRRVLLKSLSLMDKVRTSSVISRIFALSEEEVEIQLNQILSEFAERHHDITGFYKTRYKEMLAYIPPDTHCSATRALIIGAYFSHEYSLESAALFNPSMVWHPDQHGLPEGSHRIILSLRATGEGHISSITFRSGTIDKYNNITIDQPSRLVIAPEIHTHPSIFEKQYFINNIIELGLSDFVDNSLIYDLPEKFTLNELKEKIELNLPLIPAERKVYHSAVNSMLSLALTEYQLKFNPDHDISERVIFPVTPLEIKGIEDARFVQFKDGSEINYYATYTAFDGYNIQPKLLETRDFINFTFLPIAGPAIKNKGLALFPRKINGRYAMLSRRDSENNFIIFSDDLHFWKDDEIIHRPVFPWEYIQLGNCGSPLETTAGWLVLSHGVGAMRKYVIGAFLLDLENPTRVIGRTSKPVLFPEINEREGYVPNVVYSCGSAVHGNELIIPYAMSDYSSSFAAVNLKDLLDELTV